MFWSQGLFPNHQQKYLYFFFPLHLIAALLLFLPTIYLSQHQALLVLPVWLLVGRFLICCYFWLPSKLCMILIAVAQNCNHPQTSPNISRSSQELLSRPEGFEQWIFSSILPVLPQPREPKHLPSTQLAQPHPGQHRQERSSLVEPKCTERCWKKTLMRGFKN